MPRYLFTFHAYGSWMPDRKRGYVKRGKGILPRDPKMAQNYRNNMNERPVEFDAEVQKLMIYEWQVASSYQHFRLHGIGTDPTHIHGLVSWRDPRGWEPLRKSIR